MKQYLKKQEGVSTPLATRYKPSFSKSEYNGFGELYQDGKWYEDVATFADDMADTSNWTASNAILSIQEGYLKVADNGGFSSAYKAVNVIVGKKYRLICNHFTSSGSNVASIFVGSLQPDGSTNYGEYALISGTSGSLDTIIVPNSTTFYICLNSNATDSALYDSISLIPLNDDGSIDISNATELTTPQTYLPIVANVDDQGNIVDIDSFDVPTLVEKSITAETVNAETKGKNSCTAWVNFDGTTTPPTIRDSYNVKDVVRTATAQYKVYFENSMNNTNYSFVALNNGGARQYYEGTSFTHTEDVFEVEGWDYNGGQTNQSVYVQILGGKN